MDRGPVHQFRMEGSAEHTALTNEDGIARMLGQDLEIRSDRSDLRRADKDRLDPLGSGYLGDDRRAEAVDLTTVRIALDCKVHEADARLIPPFNLLREEYEPSAGTEDWKTILDSLHQPIHEAEADEKTPHDRALAARKDEGLGRLYVGQGPHLEGLGPRPLDR